MPYARDFKETERSERRFAKSYGRDPPDAKHRGRVRFFYYCYSKVVLIKNIFERKNILDEIKFK